MVKVDFSVVRGDTWAQTFEIVNDGVPLDLTGAVVTFFVKRLTSVEEIIISRPAAIAASQATITLFPTDNLFGTYYYDVEAVAVDGSVHTLVGGNLKFLGE